MILSKFFKPSTTIGLEITSSQIRLVEADISYWPVRVLNFALFDLLSPYEDNIVQQIKGVWERGQFKGRRVNIVLSHPAIIHRLISLPPIPEEEIGVIVEREVNGEKPHIEKPVFDWQVIGEVTENGVRKKGVLFVVAPLAEVNQKISLVENAGLRCGIFTTIPLTLLSSLKFIKDGEKGVVAFLYLGTERGYLLFAREGKWCFSREFPWDREGFGGERVLSEIKRSLHYFKQQFRNEDLDRIIIGKEEEEDWQVVKGKLEDSLGVRVEVFDPTYGLDLTLIKGRVKEWEKVLPRLAIILGLVRQYPEDTVINLIPSGVKRKGKELKRRALAGSLAAMILLGLLAGYGGLSQSLKSQTEILQQRKAVLREFQPFLEKGAVWEEKRRLYDRSLSFFNDKKSFPWWGMFHYFSIIVPDGMVFHSLEAGRIEGGWEVNIKGEIMAFDSFAVQGIFNQFYSRFKSNPIFSHIELMPMSITRLKEEVEGAGKEEAEGGGMGSSSGKKEKSKAEFEIKCRLREKMGEV
ncbi:MAG: pilus assembly protein PilM [Pseudomonadota bacterium]